MTLVVTERRQASFVYLEAGLAQRKPSLVLLHGMLGEPSNWDHTLLALAQAGYHALAPLLPMYDMPLKAANVPSLVAFMHRFVSALHLSPVIFVGNSLGGQLALLYTLTYPDQVVALVLTGSSGIEEVELGTSTFRRYDRAYIRERAALTFYDPGLVTDALIDRILAIIHDRQKALRLIRLARSAQSETVADRLDQLKQPVLLVWGKNDRITPPEVAQRFAQMLPQATLHFIDRCGHAPMMEQPETFNAVLLAFLQRLATVSFNGRSRSAETDTTSPNLLFFRTASTT